MKARKQPRWVYISGRGHSGSTILGLVLGSSEASVHVGELVAAIDNRAGQCACNVPTERCEFWRSVDAATAERLVVTSALDGGKWFKSFFNIFRFPLYAFSTRGSLKRTAAASFDEALLEAIGEASGRGIVVDSSKEISRALFLLKLYDATRVIHLLRKPSQVLGSVLHRVRNGDGFMFMRRRYKRAAWLPVYLTVAASGWLVGNLLAAFLSRLYPDRFFFVRYEALSRSPRTILVKIAQRIKLPHPNEFASLVDTGLVLTPAHAIGGNRIRTQHGIKFRPGVGRSVQFPWYFKPIVSLLDALYMRALP